MKTLAKFETPNLSAPSIASKFQQVPPQSMPQAPPGSRLQPPGSPAGTAIVDIIDSRNFTQIHASTAVSADTAKCIKVLTAPPALPRYR